MQGLLLVDKPKGWTSFDVVNYVRKIVARAEDKKPRNVKVGHTGTLDPAATGLLVLCVGREYTKKVPSLIKHDKSYVAEITFGASSTTGDVEGVIEQDSHMPVCTKTDMDNVLPNFIGTIQQTPPSYSAVKVNGKRAYELAREGKTPDIQPREITIHDIYTQSFNWPTATITCHVGSGTYIRVLAEDIGKALGTTAYLSGLRRTVVDTWSVDQAVQVDDLSEEVIRENLLAL
jgi:tRNA pseudouridine55 synthase